MTERKVIGLFLGVPILSEGSYTEDERLRRNGFGYAVLSLFSYGASDYVTSVVLACLCLCVTAYVNITDERNFYFRLTLSILFSMMYLIVTMRSGIVGLAPVFTVATLTYYGLMYFAHFDR